MPPRTLGKVIVAASALGWVIGADTSRGIRPVAHGCVTALLFAAVAVGSLTGWRIARARESKKRPPRFFVHPTTLIVSGAICHGLNFLAACFRPTHPSCGSPVPLLTTWLPSFRFGLCLTIQAVASVLGAVGIWQWMSADRVLDDIIADMGPPNIRYYTDGFSLVRLALFLLFLLFIALNVAASGLMFVSGRR